MWTMAAALFPLSLTASQAPERVGVFRTPSIVVAYYRSGLWLEQVRQRRDELKTAKRAGDRRKVEELQKWGRESQRLAHRQLAGKAPVDNILDALQPLLGEVARRAGVSRVVLDAPPGAETVDVTSHILDALHADAATRKMVERLRRKPGSL
ncbi:MAG: hypothetical protein WHT08_12855 [Bryobacteraceae bacterium]|jgi:hypothetical protein